MIISPRKRPDATETSKPPADLILLSEPAGPCLLPAPAWTWPASADPTVLPTAPH